MYATSVTTKNKGLAALTANPQYNTSKGNATDISLYNQPAFLINCDRYKTCFVDIGTLDTSWQIRTHLKGDCVCCYLTELPKFYAKSIFDGCERGNFFALMYEEMLPILSKHYPIKKNALDQFVKSGSILTQEIGG